MQVTDQISFDLFAERWDTLGRNFYCDMANKVSQ